jgi:hypothetical protein
MFHFSYASSSPHIAAKARVKPITVVPAAEVNRYSPFGGVTPKDVALCPEAPILLSA